MPEQEKGYLQSAVPITPFLHAAPRHVMVHLITAYRQKPVVRATKKWISEAVDDLGLY